jgi:NADPH:quinone reductase-like Zn-dependent oxidoreductase
MELWTLRYTHLYWSCTGIHIYSRTVLAAACIFITMKAIQIHSYGGPEVLQYEDAPDPQPGPGEVLIQVVAASVNPLDWKMRSGALAHLRPIQFPFILGWDVSGNVVSVGEGVTSFKRDDRVFGLLDTARNGGYAELVVAAEALLSPLSDGLDPVDAAAYPMVSLTGVELIENGLEAKAGQRVLVTGALGSVGRAAIYALKQIGAEAIAGVRASERDQASALDADGVVALDDPDDLKRAGPFDAVADTIGQAVTSKLLPYIRKGGLLATVVPPPPQPDAASGITAKPFFAKPNRALLDRIGKAAANGDFELPIAEDFPLSEARQAHTLGEKGAKGKILLTL